MAARRGTQGDDPIQRDASGLFAPVTVARTSSAIADQIRRAILGGKLSEGERLPPERELAEQFGVSRVSVRDALRVLEAMGLIEVRVGARGGAFVTAPTGSLVEQTISDMMIMQVLAPEDIVEARLIVELGTVTLATARATEENLAALRDLDVRAREALAARTYTREISWDFHRLLAVAAQNTAVEGMTRSFRNSLSMHRIRTREGVRGHERTVEEHGRILQAIERRDGTTARRELAGHLLRGTGLEKRESELLALWDARSPAQRAASNRRAK